MHRLVIPRESNEYIKVAVSGRNNGSIVDVTVTTVFLALVAPGKRPTDDSWQAAAWETDSGVYKAKVLVGSGTLDPNPGIYDVWLKMVGSPETVIRKAGEIEIT